MPWTENWLPGGGLAACPAICLLLFGSLGLRAQTTGQSPGQSGTSLPALPPARPAQPRFLVILDPAHGGSDLGAHLNAQLAEKDLVLRLADTLRSALHDQGIETIATRSGDAAVTAVHRAEIANRQKPAACILLHATTSGSGVHLFTSSEAPAAAVPLLPWDAAQAPFIQQSLKLSSEINSAMTHAEIPVTLGRTSLQPLDNMACPAVAVEVAPLVSRGNIGTPLTDAAYQQQLVGALAAAVAAWQRDWTVRP